jgi:hypothetical protein
MSPRRLVYLVPITITIVVAVVWTASARDGFGPAGAERIADTDGLESLGRTSSGEPDLDELSLDDLELNGATAVWTGQGGRVIVSVVVSASQIYLIDASTAGEVSRIHWDVINRRATAFTVSPRGHFAWATDSGQPAHSMLVDEPDSLNPAVGTWLTADFPVGAIGVIDDDSVIVGSSQGPSIDLVTADEPTMRLLGPTGDRTALVTTDEGLGHIVGLTRLDDHRTVFVADTPDGLRLYVLDDTSVRPVTLDPGSPNPVRSTGRRRADIGSREHLAMTPLAPGPDGHVLTIGLNPDDVPEISLVDVDTGDTELLATLDSVEPTIDEPLSAALAGDDLVFTAHGSVWRLADVTDR